MKFTLCKKIMVDGKRFELLTSGICISPVSLDYFFGSQPYKTGAPTRLSYPSIKFTHRAMPALS